MESLIAQQTPASSSAGWTRIAALVYDPFVWVAELAGMRSRRKGLLAQASGSQRCEGG